MKYADCIALRERITRKAESVAFQMTWAQDTARYLRAYPVESESERGTADEWADRANRLYRAWMRLKEAERRYA